MLKMKPAVIVGPYSSDCGVAAGEAHHHEAHLAVTGAAPSMAVIDALVGPHGDLSRALAEALHVARTLEPYRGHELVTAIKQAFDALREIRRAVKKMF